MRLHHLMEHAILVRIQGLLIFQPLREDIPHVIGQAILMAPRTSDELRVHGLRHLKAFSSLSLSPRRPSSAASQDNQFR